MKNIKLFKLFSIKQKLLLKFDFFSTREEVLKDLKSHSFIITAHKIFKRNKKKDKIWINMKKKQENYLN